MHGGTDACGPGLYCRCLEGVTVHGAVASHGHGGKGSLVQEVIGAVDTWKGRVTDVAYVCLEGLGHAWRGRILKMGQENWIRSLFG